MIFKKNEQTNFTVTLFLFADRNQVNSEHSRITVLFSISLSLMYYRISSTKQKFNSKNYFILIKKIFVYYFIHHIRSGSNNYQTTRRNSKLA